ncbi:MAG: DUF739 family protein [Bacilli bacterium]|nr:DUF739 family protein [Bacilli bacterium]
MKVEFDYSKLKGRIKEKLNSQYRLAEELKISEVALWNKLTNKSAFSQTDIVKICEILEIEPNEIHNYFFREVVKEN